MSASDRPASRAELISMIKLALQDACHAIRSHPADIVTFFDRANAAHEAGMAGATPTDWSKAAGFSLPELAVIQRYLFTVSFMSTYWDLHGDLPRRDKAAQSAALLVAGLGLEPEAVMRRLLQYENTWKAGLKAERIWQVNQRA